MPTDRPYPDSDSALVLQVQQLKQDLASQHAQAMATAEVLKAIEKASSDIQPVFDTIAKSSTELCMARFCILWRYDGTLLHYVASHGLPRGMLADYQSNWPAPPFKSSVSESVIAKKKLWQLRDAQDETYRDHQFAKEFRFREMVGVPIFSGDEVEGIITLAWPEDDAPDASNFDLLQNFASQAGIAMENARLFNETQEALEYQTATSDVLAVISKSPNELDPVLDEILNVAARICRPQYAFMALLHASDGKYHVEASRHADKVFLEYMQANPVEPGRGTCIGRAALLGETVYVEDT